MIKKATPYILAGSLCVASTLFAQDAAPEAPAKGAPAPAPAEAAPEMKKVSPEEVKKNSSYWFGFRNGSDFARQISQGGISKDDLDQDQFVKGVLRGMSGEQPEVSEEDLQASLKQFGEMMQAKEKADADANLEAGNKFLAENKKRKEVKTTASGLQYEIMKKGEGEVYKAPADGAPSNVQFLVNYKGTLPDGTVFDQSPEGQPVPMPLQVIPGFKEALTTMPIGSKWKLFIPSNLAYGPQRAGNLIGPNQALIFELEVLKIIQPPATPPVPGGVVPPANGGAPKASATSKPIEVPAPKK